MTAIDTECRIGARRYFLRKIADGEAPAVLALFARVFGEIPPAGWYAWKYGTAGLAGRALGLWDETGQLVAHCAGFPRVLLWKGRPVAALQIGDVMVAPEERNWLTRRGPFFQVCETFYRYWIGADKPFVVSYGFPNARHMRLGIHLGLYVDQGSVDIWCWSAARRQGWSWYQQEIVPNDACFERSVNATWAAMQKSMHGRILGVRDAAYVRSRFVSRPGVNYRYTFVARRGFGPTALAIWRAEAVVLRWIDYIGPPAILKPVVRALQHIATVSGLARVEIWASAAAGKDLHANGAAHTGGGARFALVNPSCCPDGALADHGWWLGGDTDFL